MPKSVDLSAVYCKCHHCDLCSLALFSHEVLLRVPGKTVLKLFLSVEFRGLVLHTDFTAGDGGAWIPVGNLHKGRIERKEFFVTCSL